MVSPLRLLCNHTIFRLRVECVKAERDLLGHDNQFRKAVSPSAIHCHRDVDQQPQIRLGER